MRQRQIMILLALSILSFFGTNLRAQDCPTPENLTITVDYSTQPPTAHVSWTVPPGSNVVGFIFRYSIDGAPPITINLPLTPTAYDVTLPINWQEMEVELVSVCKDGGISEISRAKVATIIIEDMVLFSPGGAEQIICTKPCKGSSYFYYSQGSGLNNPQDPGDDPVGSPLGTVGIGEPLPAEGSGMIEVFKNLTFCNCMAANVGGFQNQTVVDGCRMAAREFLTMGPNLSFCRPTSNRSAKSSQIGASAVSLYPNPASSELLIQTESAGVRCIITTISGTPMMPPFELQSSTSIQVSDWKSGVYLIRATDQNGEVSVGKFVKI